MPNATVKTINAFTVKLKKGLLILILNSVDLLNDRIQGNGNPKKCCYDNE